MSTLADSVPSQTDQAKELSLVGKVELRIALADSDLKLQTILHTYLPPLLLKLASNHPDVRNKVISICQHVNTRIKPPTIQLPVDKLLKQFKDNRNTFIRHFDLLYIQRGIERLTREERSNLLSPLLRGIHSNYTDSGLYTAKVFNLFLQVLHSFDLPARGSEDDVVIRTQLGFDEHPKDARFIASWLGKLMLFSANKSGEKRCPGLDIAEHSFLRLQDKEDTWRPDAAGGMNLAETKILSAKFLASGAFLDSERFLPALFASVDTDSRLSEIGNGVLKRLISSISLEDRPLVEQLFQVYLGTRGVDGSLPAGVPLRIKILGFLSKSKLSATFIDQSIQIIHEGLMPVETKRLLGDSASSKPGLESSKLRIGIFAFTNWLVRSSSPSSIKAFALTLVSQLRGYIEVQGWPQILPETARPNSPEVGARDYCYESIGLLAAACPELLLLQPKIDLLQWLFASLSADPSTNTVSLSIEQALGSILGAFSQDLNTQLEESLSKLLLKYMTFRPGEKDGYGHEVVRSTRFIALRFTNRCLPFRNVTARWINVLALREDINDRSEIREEGKKGLDPYWYRILNPQNPSSTTVKDWKSSRKYELPDFREVIMKFFGPGAEWNITELERTQHKISSAYGIAINFCRLILLSSALTSIHKSPNINAEWEQNIDALVSSDEDSRIHIKSFLNRELLPEDGFPNALETYLATSFYAFIKLDSADSNESGRCLLELCSLACDSSMNGLTSEVSSLAGSVVSNHKSHREIAAHVFGIIASREQSSKATVQGMVQSFDQKIQNWAQAIGGEINAAHGAILATAYFVSRAYYRKTMRMILEKLRPNFIRCLFDILNKCRDKMLLEAATVAISELALFAVILSDTIQLPLGQTTLAKKLEERAKSGDEKAIMALGHIAMQCDENQEERADLNQIIDILYGLHEVRQPEVQLAVGTSLTCAAAGWSSKALTTVLDIEGLPPRSCERKTTLPRVVMKVLLDCRKTKPALRQAAVIWLLCLVQYCGHMDDIQSRLRECQSAFIGFLADRDSLNQESASRGLTLVYEKGDKSLKEDLVRDLIASFTGSAKNLAGKVSDETELFEPGALPTSEGSVTTYKDIMSLASEVGDPGLVYKFMSLASNNAIWSSRAAFGRFGLSNILSNSNVGGKVAQNPKLYPALFRYRFDPNPNVKTSMNEIWNTLATEPAAIIDLHFDIIMEDLLKNILGKEWRVRQASCAAIAELLQVSPVGKYEGYLGQIWANAFKVCDDIKNSVRVEAMNLAKVLTGTLTRILKGSGSSSRKATTMLEKVVPFLLSPSGLESSAKEVQSFALFTLLEIIKSSSGTALRPFIPDMIFHMIALLSSLEPDVVNYIHLNADKYNIQRDDIDDARLSVVKGSPMMEAIERCLDVVDDATMAALSSKLEDSVKTAIGLPSKVGTTRVLVSLSTRHNAVFKVYADRFFRLIRRQVLDQNDTVSSAFAAACGYIARLASDREILKLFTYCQQLYFDCEEDRQRKISGDVVYAVSRHAADRFKSLASEIIPFVFVAKHDISHDVKMYFQDSWDGHVGGSRAVLLYLQEIKSLIVKQLDSPRWSVKHTSALALANLIKSLGDKVNDSDATSIWPVLEKALSGKTWEGKETVLEGLLHLVKSSDILTLDESYARQIEIVVFRESKRNNPTYRRHALACLERFLEFSKSKGLYSQVYDITQPVIEEILDSRDDMDVDGPIGGASSKSVNEGTLASSMAALLKSINPQLQSQSDLALAMTQALDLAERVVTRDGNRLALNAIYDGYKSLYENILLSTTLPLSGNFEDVLLRYIKAFTNPEGRVEESRLKSAEALMAIGPVVVHSERLKLTLLDAISTARAKERSVIVQESLDRVKKRIEEGLDSQG